MTTEGKPFILIPAKAESVRLKNKNMLPLGRKPLVEHAVDRAVWSGLAPGGVYLSTESHWIIDYFLERPTPVEINIIVRPEGLSAPHVRAVEVVLHSIEMVGKYYDSFVMTLPTSPFCEPADIQVAYELFLRCGRKPVMSMTRTYANPNTIMRAGEAGELSPYTEPIGYFPDWNREWVESGTKLDRYVSNGAVYVCDIEMFKEQEEFYIEGMVGYEMPASRGINIDTELDYILALALWERSGKV